MASAGEHFPVTGEIICAANYFPVKGRRKKITDSAVHRIDLYRILAGMKYAGG